MNNTGSTDCSGLKNDEVNCNTVSKWKQTTLNTSFFNIFDFNKLFSNKPFSVIILNTWSLDTPSQLSQIEKMIQTDQSRSFLTIFPHESNMTIELYKKRGGYTLNMKADPDGEAVLQLPYINIPTIYDVDVNGVVVAQRIGLQKQL